MTRFCLPIQADSAEAVYQRIDAAQSRYDLLEVWLDAVSGPVDDLIRNLAARFESRLILLLRAPGLREPLRSPAERIRLTRLIAELPVLLDLDITSQEAELSSLQGEWYRAELITSYHDYDNTPSQKELEAVVGKMAAYNPAIYKVASFCRSERDAVRLLTLGLDLRDAGHRHIVLGMGPHGVVTRIFGAVWGNEVAFAPETREAASAPGQLTLSELTETFNLIGRSGSDGLLSRR